MYEGVKEEDEKMSIDSDSRRSGDWERSNLHNSEKKYTGSARDYFNKILHISQMDVDYTFFQMMYLCCSPNKLYQLTKWRKRNLHNHPKKPKFH
jgi:hypothetical protein